MHALKYFCPSSSGGVDGLRPAHLEDLISCFAEEDGRCLRASFTCLCSIFLLDNLTTRAGDLFFSESITALRKKDDDIHSFTVRNTSPRLPPKWLVVRSSDASNSIPPHNHLLNICHTRAPSLNTLAHLAYSSINFLLAANNPLIFATAVQQSDPIGALLFALAIDGIARCLVPPQHPVPRRRNRRQSDRCCLQ